MISASPETEVAPISPVAETSSVPRSSRQAVVLALLLIVGSFSLYAPVGRHPFANYDDDRYVADNVHVRSGLSWESIKWAFTTYDEGNWHPVTWLSHMVDCQLFGVDPAGHHYVNVALHGVNAALLFLVLYGASGFLWRSFVVAALFGLHPLNVESVAWVAERKNILSMLFFLLALGVYGWYARRPGVKRYSLVAVFFALGLMAKPQIITFPFILLLWDYWPLRRVGPAREPAQSGSATIESKTWTWLLLEKLPLFAMCLPSALLTMRAQTAEGAVTSFKRYSLAVRLANAVVSYTKYLGKTWWPSRLSVLYPYQPDSLTKLQISLSVLLLVLISAGVAVAGRRYLTVGWLWFLGTLVPMIGLVQVGVQAMADRYAYLPLIGLFIAIGWAIADLAQRFHVSTKWLGAICAVLLGSLGWATLRQMSYWKDDLTLWSHAAAVTSGNYVAEDGMGNALLARGALEEAMPHFRTAAAIHPADPISNTNLAFYKVQHNDLAGGLAQYKTVTENAVDARLRANAFLNMGLIEAKLGNLNDARTDFQTAVNLRPRNVRAWIGLGAAAQRSGDGDGAVQAYSRAVTLQATDVTYLLLAGALEQSGQRDAAAAADNRAIQLSQNIDETRRIVRSLIGP